MSDPRAQGEIDALIQRFYAAFDNRDGRIARCEDVTALFADRAIVAKYGDGRCELASPDEFASPRVALLASGELTDFHEWEVTAATTVAGGIASRTSRYAKSGLYAGKAYAGTGTKFFQMAEFASIWKIVALCWTDDAAE